MIGRETTSRLPIRSTASRAQSARIPCHFRNVVAKANLDRIPEDDIGGQGRLSNEQRPATEGGREQNDDRRGGG